MPHVTIRDLERDVRATRSARTVAGRLAAVLAACPTCDTPRGLACRATTWDDAPPSSGIHAARATAAADMLRDAP